MKKIYYFKNNKILQSFIVLLFFVYSVKAQFKIDPRFEDLKKEQQLQEKNSENNASKNILLPTTIVVLPNGENKKFYDAIIYTKNPQLLKEKGVILQTITKEFATALISLDNIDLLRDMPEVISVNVPEVDEIEKTKNLISSGASILHSGALNDTNYTGKGILVGIYDSGIDFTHPDFRYINDKNKSRILKLWDQTITKIGEEKTPEGFDYGVEYNQTEISEELSGKTNGFVRQKDINGHGTHVAGIAAGNGSAFPTFAYKGMAPEADLIIVKGGDGSFSTSRIIDGINYFNKVATELNKPIVVNFSIGGHYTAHDGTYVHEKVLNEFTESAPGRIVTASAGNNGNANLHKRVFLKPNERKGFSLKVSNFKENNTTSVFNFTSFIKEKKELPITIYVTDPKGIEYKQSIDTDSIYSFNNSSIKIRATNSIEINSGKRYTTLRVYRENNSKRSPSGVYKLEYENNSSEDITIDGWLYGRFSGLATSVLEEGDNYYNVGAPGSSDGAITVANYIDKNSYVINSYKEGDDKSNSIYSNTSYQYGALTPSSSKGPRADEVEKPDLAAGGANIIAAASKDAGDTEFADKTLLYIRKTGTSMSTPATAGAIALLLQANNNLDAKKVKDILKSNTTKDSFTTQNYTREFGYGKLNIYKALKNQIDNVNNNNSCVISNNFITLATDNINYFFGSRVGTGSLIIKDKSAVKKITSNTNGVLNNISVYVGFYDILERVPLKIEIKKVNEDGSVGELIATKEVADLKELDMGGWNTISFKDANINLKEGESIYVFITTTYPDLKLVTDLKSSENNYHLAFNTSFTSTDGIVLTPLTNNELKIRGFLVEEGLNYKEIKLEDITNAFSRLNVNLGNNHFVKDCKMQLSIDSNGSNPLKGFVTSTLWIDNQEPKYVKRRFQINPENKDKFSTGKVTLYFTQEDFDEYNALNTINNFKLPSNKEDKASLENAIIYFAEGISEDNSGVVKSYDTKLFQIPIKPENLVWNEEKQYWELSFDAIGFGGYLLGTRSKLANTDDLNIGLYPNPIKEYLNIQLPYNLLNANVKIYDTNGRLIRNYELKEINNKLDLNSLVKGVYFIEIKKANTKIIKKIIKI